MEDTAEEAEDFTCYYDLTRKPRRTFYPIFRQPVKKHRSRAGKLCRTTHLNPEVLGIAVSLVRTIELMKVEDHKNGRSDVEQQDAERTEMVADDDELESFVVIPEASTTAGDMLEVSDSGWPALEDSETCCTKHHTLVNDAREEHLVARLNEWDELTQNGDLKHDSYPSDDEMCSLDEEAHEEEREDINGNLLDRIPSRELFFYESLSDRHTQCHLRSKHKWKKMSARIQIKQKHIYELSVRSRGKNLHMKYHLRNKAVKQSSGIEIGDSLGGVIFEQPRYKNDNNIHRRGNVSNKRLWGDYVKSGVSIPRYVAYTGPAGGTSNGCRPARTAATPAHRKEPKRHEVTAYNIDFGIPHDVANVLVNLQHRDLTPEDYELLLRLDERVAPKTVDKQTVDTLPVSVVECEEEMTSQHCPVCMEQYVSGDKYTTLPCQHRFHTTCIEMWLLNSSINCPLDGVPVFAQ